jgi:hypothetical protein
MKTVSPSGMTRPQFHQLCTTNFYLQYTHIKAKKVSKITRNVCLKYVYTGRAAPHRAKLVSLFVSCGRVTFVQSGWNITFSQRRKWRRLDSGMLRRVIWQKRNRRFRGVCRFQAVHLPGCSRPKRLPSSHTIITPFFAGPAMDLPCPTRSHFSNQLPSREWLIGFITEGERTSETSINFYRITRHNIPEGTHLRL